MAFKDAEIASLDNLIHRLENKEFDLVAVGRALIANPDWVNKVRDEQYNELTPFNKSMLAKLA